MRDAAQEFGGYLGSPETEFIPLEDLFIKKALEDAMDDELSGEPVYEWELTPG